MPRCNNPTYNYSHSTSGNLMPTLSLKLNLILILTLLTLLNLTNPKSNSNTVKLICFRWITPQCHPNDTILWILCTSEDLRIFILRYTNVLIIIIIRNCTGHQPALGLTDFLTSSAFCLPVWFLMCRHFLNNNIEMCSLSCVAGWSSRDRALTVRRPCCFFPVKRLIRRSTPAHTERCWAAREKRNVS